MRPIPGQLNPCPGATLCICTATSRVEKPPKERLYYAAFLPQRRLFQFLPSVSTGMRLQHVLFFPPQRRLLKYASASHALWSGVDQYLVPVFFFLFMRILPSKARVNLSDIISQVGGVIDCGSNGERKSGGPDINIPCQFSVCLLVTCERAAQGTRGVNTHTHTLIVSPFPAVLFAFVFPLPLL